ncbi:MAG: TonB-dependent receptor plug domain-containing protein [Alphaproteobacteria bacterium]|nr:TonB-dependent receptor plug domain-containing protein [Alphaproteobacteria bacterium]
MKTKFLSRTEGQRPAVSGLMIATSAVALMHCGAALAQPGVSGAPAVVDDVITVRATRRETSLQETPVAVTALNAEQANSLVPQDLGDVAAYVPNFSASKVTGFNAASFAIRGAAQTDIIVYSESQVAVTLDDFVVPHVQTQLLDVFDIEQVEVLRGPQGTLFGKNSTAGVVSLRTKRPVLGEYGADARLQYGSFDRLEGRLAVNIPISDQFAFRFAGQYTRSQGYYRNGAEFGPVTPFGQLDMMGNNINPTLGATGQGDGSRLGGEDVVSLRSKLLWQPNDSLQALFQYELIRENSDAVPAVNETPIGDPRFVFNNLGFTQDPGDPLDNAGITADSAIGDFGIGLDNGHQVNVNGYYLNIEWDAGPVQFTSITGLRKQQSELANNYVGEVGPVSQFDANRADDRETFQQEIRANFTIGDNLDVVAGGFYQSNDTTFCVTQVLGFLDLFGLAPFGTFNNNPQVLCNAQDANAYSLFADGTYAVTDRLTIGGGFRYTWENKEWIGRNQIVYQALGGGFDPLLNINTVGLLGGADFDRFPTGVLADTTNGDFNEPSWRALVSYEFSDDAYGYASVSHSFRSGAFNDQSGTTGNELTAALIAPTRPELATSYEAGLRLDLFDGTLRLNPTFFFVNYTDAQRQIAATLTNSVGVDFQETRFFNAADARVYGIELEGRWITPIEGFLIGGNFSWQDAKFKSFQADTDFDGVIDVDFSNRSLTRTPEITWTAYGRYETRFSDATVLRLGATAAFEDSNIFSYSDIDPAFDTTLNERTLLTLTAEIADIDDAWSIRLFGRNVTDERYRVSSQAVANLWVFSQYGAPRTWGIEIGGSF